jgi:tetratricopeptide (TPR) repeat protein
VGLDDVAGGENDFGIALRLMPNNATALQNRAVIFMETKRWQEALDDLAEAVNAAPEMAHLYELRATCREALGDLAGAGTELTVALSKAPDSTARARIQDAISRIASSSRQ